MKRSAANGEFSLANLAGCRDYTVTPSADGLFFTKPSRTYTYLSMNQPFTAFAANKPPTVTLFPPSGTHNAPASVTLHAEASDTTGAVSKVDFYVGTTLVGTDSLTTGEAIGPAS